MSFHLEAPQPAYLWGDGILPADFDGDKRPKKKGLEFFLGTMDPDFPDGAPFDGLNFFESNVDFKKPAKSTFQLTKQIPIANFDTVFPCVGALGSRDCIPQPGVGPTQFLDILCTASGRPGGSQYRNFGRHESLVTNLSDEAAPTIAGVRWFELRKPRDPVIYQEGTLAPADGHHRWMGSAAMDQAGNLAVGYSVSSGHALPGHPLCRPTGRRPARRPVAGRSRAPERAAA